MILKTEFLRDDLSILKVNKGVRLAPVNSLLALLKQYQRLTGNDFMVQRLEAYNECCEILALYSKYFSRY